MKRTTRHLPKRKRDELKEIVSIINQNAQAEMVVLFGSHARGDWVEDIYVEDHTTYEYRSDFDILVVVGQAGLVRKTGTWDKIDAAIARTDWIKTPTTIIVHDIGEVNKHISEGQYFFRDIRQEGAVLHDSGRLKLGKTQPLKAHERRAIAQADFKQWFTSARRFNQTARDLLKKGWLSESAFLMHQATERFYVAVLLVFTHYKPKVHDIEELGRRAANLDPRFLPVFPRQTEEQRRLFNLLKKAYIDARYKRNYTITKAELEYLGARVGKLERLTRKICGERIAAFGLQESTENG
jgi:HEPN domain-containing protein/predicted nucleotidyltransferase